METANKKQTSSLGITLTYYAPRKADDRTTNWEKVDRCIDSFIL